MKTNYFCTNQHCYITNEPLSVNETAEHIIPNALGGHLKSKKLVLSRINTGLFDRLDAELADMIELPYLIKFKRERGKQPCIKGRVASKIGHCAISSQQGFLNDIFGICLVVYQPRNNSH